VAAASTINPTAKFVRLLSPVSASVSILHHLPARVLRPRPTTRLCEDSGPRRPRLRSFQCHGFRRTYSPPCGKNRLLRTLQNNRPVVANGKGRSILAGAGEWPRQLRSGSMLARGHGESQHRCMATVVTDRFRFTIPKGASTQ
jgi:hypothetical protein